MNWWTIVKQGKILTLPKTQLRIKKPSKVEERKCKDKLLEYRDKLLNSFGDMHLRPLLNQPEYTSIEINNYKYLEDSDKILGGHRDKLLNSFDMTKGKGKGITGEYYDYAVGEYIYASNRELIEALPEEVCCLALDVMKLSGEHLKSSEVGDLTKKNQHIYQVYWKDEMKPVDIDYSYTPPSHRQDWKMWEGGQYLQIYDTKSRRKGCELTWNYHIPSEGFLPKPPEIDWT